MISGTEKICGICGTKFICGTLGGCWCTNVRVTPGKKNLISRLTDDCVCPECLKD